ncbi:MAG: MarR family transcriptional regulator [Acidobacteria bacterium]|nr:MarR family transcriptional regulator [Acidobacteriota bacterium]
MAPKATAATKPAPATDVTRLRMALARLGRRLRQEGTAIDDVTPSQVSAMASLDQLGAATLGELAAAERIQPPSMTRIVARLEEGGFVSRTVDQTDRRCVRVELTPAGSEFLTRSRTRRDAYLTDRVADLSPDEQALLADALPILEQLLGEER